MQLKPLAVQSDAVELWVLIQCRAGGDSDETLAGETSHRKRCTLHSVYQGTADMPLYVTTSLPNSLCRCRHIENTCEHILKSITTVLRQA